MWILFDSYIKIKVESTDLWKTSLCLRTGLPDRKLPRIWLEVQAAVSLPWSGDSIAATCSRLSRSSVNGVNLVNRSAKKYLINKS